MAEAKFNSIAFCRDDYLTYNDYLERDCIDEDALFEDVKSVIRIALKNGNQTRVWDDGCTVVVEFEHMDPDLADSILMWVSMDDADNVFAAIDGVYQDEEEEE